MALENRIRQEEEKRVIRGARANEEVTVGEAT